VAFRGRDIMQRTHGTRMWLLAAPLGLYVLAFLAYPTAYAVKLACTDSLTQTFPSLSNFRLIARDNLFWQALWGNMILPIASVALEVVAGLGLAVLVAARFPGRRLLRLVVMVPFALPEIVFLTIMRSVFAPRGYANAALVAVGAPAIEWLLPGRALTFFTVVLVDAWHVTPVVFLMVLEALTAVPDEIDEAAQLDGAGPLARFFCVTLPLLRPALLAAVLLRGLDALRMFATPLVLAGVEGAPVLSTYAYHQWSDYGNDGAAAAAASALALLCTAVTLLFLRRRVAT
jgi:ABC-type sugar transport system permease subunit